MGNLASLVIFQKCYFIIFLFLFMALPVAYGSSQARGQIEAAAAGLCHSHSNWGSELRLQPTLQLVAAPTLNPQCDTKDRTCILMDTSWVCYCWAMTGNAPSPTFDKLYFHFHFIQFKIVDNFPWDFCFDCFDYLEMLSWSKNTFTWRIWFFQT